MDYSLVTCAMNSYIFQMAAEYGTMLADKLVGEILDELKRRPAEDDNVPSYFTEWTCFCGGLLKEANSDCVWKLPEHLLKNFSEKLTVRQQWAVEIFLRQRATPSAPEESIVVCFSAQKPLEDDKLNRYVGEKLREAAEQEWGNEDVRLCAYGEDGGKDVIERMKAQLIVQWKEKSSPVEGLLNFWEYVCVQAYLSEYEGDGTRFDERLKQYYNGEGDNITVEKDLLHDIRAAYKKLNEHDNKYLTYFCKARSEDFYDVLLDEIYDAALEYESDTVEEYVNGVAEEDEEDWEDEDEDWDEDEDAEADEDK